MKKFSLIQKFDAPADAVIAVFRREETWRAFAALPFVGDPEIISFDDGEPVEIAMSYRVSMDLPSLAHNFIDPKKLTFVEKTRLEADGSGSFKIVPDHYKKLLKSRGTSEVVDTSDGRAERRIQGSVDVSLGWAGKLFEGPVEDAIVNGLREALEAQASQVTDLN